MFKRLCYKILQLGEQWQKQHYMDAPVEAGIRPATNMERMFGDCQPALVAFKIDNGYVVRTIHMGPEYVGQVASGFVYCKDHAAIADHIVTEAAREKVMPNYAQISNAKIGQVNTAPLPYPKRP